MLSSSARALLVVLALVVLALLALLAVLLVVSPATTLVAGNLTYAPSPGVGWYLWWLLLFDVVYVSFQTTPPVDEALVEALTGADAPTAALQSVPLHNCVPLTLGHRPVWVQSTSWDARAHTCH